MAHFNHSINNKIKTLAESIPGSLLHEKGIEYEPHITVLYGFQDEFGLIEKLKAKINTISSISCTITDISYFDTNPGFDVLKFDIDSPDLVKLNSWCTKNCDYYPSGYVYHPHMTLGYMKKGARFETDGMKRMISTKLIVDHLIYSTHNKVKSKIEI